MLRAMLTTIAALVFMLAATTAMAADAGTIVSLEGTVEIGQAGTFARAGVGSVVASGNTVRTGNPGRARILFVDDSVLILGDGTTLVIDETVFDPNKGAASTLMHLLGGKVRALVSEYYTGGQGSYQIETATAVSGVRGTEFVMAYNSSSQLTEVLGLGGSVAVHSTLDRVNRGVLVKANQITEVARGKFPTTPRDIGPDDDRYRRLLAGLDLPGSGMPESLLQGDPSFGGPKVPTPDTADEALLEQGTSAGIGGEPHTELPPDPGTTGGDLLDQPQPVLEAPTDIDIHF